MNLALLAAAATGMQVGAATVATRFVVGEIAPLTLAVLLISCGLWFATRSRVPGVAR